MNDLHLFFSDPVVPRQVTPVEKFEPSAVKDVEGVKENNNVK